MIYQLFNKEIKLIVGNLRFSITMIRQISHITLAALLFILTTGFTVHQHYCSGHLVETNLLAPPDFCCGEGSDCCSNEQETVQMDVDYLDFVLQFDFEEFAFDVPELTRFNTEPIEYALPNLVPIEVSHPPDRATVLARLQVFSL